MLPIKDSLLIERHIETGNEGMEKDILRKWKQKESWDSNTHNRQNRL